MEYDVFICHASEDKVAVVDPLAALLHKRELRVWLDSMQIGLGDSLSRTIDQGLAHSRFGVVVVSKAVLAKETMWVRRELDALAAREVQGAQVVVLPIWHDVGFDEVFTYSPTLADKLAAKTTDGLEKVVEMILGRFDSSRPDATAQPSATPEPATTTLAYDANPYMAEPTDMIADDPHIEHGGSDPKATAERTTFPVVERTTQAVTASMGLGSLRTRTPVSIEKGSPLDVDSVALRLLAEVLGESPHRGRIRSVTITAEDSIDIDISDERLLSLHRERFSIDLSDPAMTMQAIGVAMDVPRRTLRRLLKPGPQLWQFRPL